MPQTETPKSLSLPYHIALETATHVCSVALFSGPSLVHEQTLARGRSHAERAVVFVKDLLRTHSLEPTDIAAVSVSQGPGSYTGLRIGVSTAKGLALACNAALIGVPTLDALADAALPFCGAGDVLVVALPSRKAEVYASAYTVMETADAANLSPLRPPAALPIADVPAWLNVAHGQKGWLLGAGASRLTPYFKQTNFTCIASEVLDASARWVGALGWKKWQAGSIEDIASFEPFYLKAFVAKKPERSAFERLPF